MNAGGVARLDLPLEDAWRRLSDLEEIGHALPAAQVVDVDGSDRFTAAFRPTTGLGATPVRMGFEVIECAAPQRLSVRGTGGAAEYAVRLDAAFELVAQGDATEVHWNLEVHLHGVLRSLTQRVFADVVTAQVTSVLDAVQRNSPENARPG